MPALGSTVLVYALAALGEIGGCFAFWAVFRLGKSIWWLAPGMLALAGFAWLLTLSPSDQAGRAFAAYGGVYILTSLIWLWAVEARQPDAWDLAGGAVALAGAAIILFAPRS